MEKFDSCPDENNSGGSCERIGHDFLGLPNCVTLRHDRIEHILLVRASYEPQSTISSECPSCHGRLSLETEFLCFWDSPRDNHPVLVQLIVPLLMCMRCVYAPDVHLPWLHAKRNMTYRLEDFILERAATLSTFSQIASDTCQELNTVIDIFIEAFRAFDKQRGKDLPRVLQIDEVYFCGEYYTILVDGDTRATVDLLKGRKNSVIERRLKEAGNAEAVEYWCQDYSQPFHDVAVRPFQYSKKQKLESFDDEQTSAETSDMLLFPEPPESDSDESTEAESYRLMREKLMALLPNALPVGDHFHFKQAIEQAFNKIRIHVQNSLSLHYYDLEIDRYTEVEKNSANWTSIEQAAKEKAKQMAKSRADELTSNRHALFKRPEKLAYEEPSWVERVRSEHSLLRQGLDAKDRGLAIFPLKPPIGRSKKAMEAAKAKRAALLMDAEEAGRRLDEWAASVEDLQQFFGRPLRLIKKWREEIIRIGTTGYTNAGAEAKNRYLRTLEAISRGLSFEMKRARVLWADAHRRTGRWPSICDDVDGKVDLQRFVELADEFLAQNDGKGQEDLKES